MVIASRATMMVPISRKGETLLFVRLGYVSRKLGFDKVGVNRVVLPYPQRYGTSRHVNPRFSYRPKACKPCHGEKVSPAGFGDHTRAATNDPSGRDVGCDSHSDPEKDLRWVEVVPSMP
jgi:hypothetical protein